MPRINFTDETGKLCWFDDDAAQAVISEGRNWDGNNWRGACSGLQTSRAALYLTRGGRWIENRDARNEFNGINAYRYLTDDEARDWLVRAADAGRDSEEAAEALAKHFPDTPEEEGPSAGGRPKIGPTINVAYPPDLLEKIDAAAEKAGMSRAAWLRRIAEEAVETA